MPRPGPRYASPHLLLPAALFGALGCAALWGALGCASRTHAPRPEGVPAAAVTGARVYEILAGRHAGGAPPDAELSPRAFDQLLRALDPPTTCVAQRAALAAERARFAPRVRAGELADVHAAALRCTGQQLSDAAAEALAFDALARGFDPNSRFIDAPALAAEQRAIHAALPEGDQARGRIVERGGRRLGWVALPSFYLQANRRGAARDVGFLAGRLREEGAELLVLDLRGNGGGVVEEALRLAGALGAAGPVAREQRGGAVEELRAPEGVLYAGPLALLIDGSTAGVAELFAAAIADRGRGRLIGARTHGHGSAQTLVLLQSPKGAPAGGVRVTDRYFLRLDGSPIEGRGVAPHSALEADELDRARPEEELADSVLRAFPAQASQAPR